MERSRRRHRDFLGQLAHELHWFKPFGACSIGTSRSPSWFVGGQTNASYNCLDVHLTGPRRNKAALIWEGEPGDKRVLTYQTLHYEVCRFANVLKKLGVRRGDVVSIYMPMVPELVIAMLACADRRGAFGDLRRLLQRSDRRSQQRRPGEARDHGRRRLAARQQLPLKANVDEALAKSPTRRKVRRAAAHWARQSR